MKPNLINIILLFISALFVSCNQEVSVGEPYEFQIDLSKAYIDSEPANAQIFVDGKNSGKVTPDTVEFLSVGEHSFTLKMYLFQDYTFPLITDTNYLAQYFHDYYSYPENFARVNIFSKPDSANIYFDDSLITEKSPYSMFPIFPGDHKFKLTYPEHRADSTSLFLRGGTNTDLSFYLEDTTIWVNYNKQNSILKSYQITDVIIAFEDEVWVGTNEDGILTIKGNQWKYFNTENSPLEGNGINRIVVSPDNTVWICSYSGLYNYDGTNWKIYTTANSNLPSDYVTDIFIKNLDTAFISTQEGLAIFDDNSFRVINTSNSSIPANFITAVAIDKNNNLWIGTNGFGVHLYHERYDYWQPFLFSNEDLNLPGDAVNDIEVDNNGIVYVTYMERSNKGERGGLATFVNGNLYVPFINISFYNMENIFMTKDGSLLIGSRSGVIWYYGTNNYKIINASNSGLKRNDITSVTVDSKGVFWIGSNGGGLTKYKTWNDPNF